MAATSTLRLNLVEWSEYFHKGKVLPQVKMLAQENALAMDMPFVMCNDGTTHVFGVDTALPTVYKTAYHEGTAPSKGQKSKEREEVTMLSGLAQVDADMARVGGQEGALRAKQDAMFAESMKQAFTQMMLYGNKADDDRDINGIATRYNKLNTTKTKNVISAGGASANAQTSIYCVNWGPDVYGIFPEGTTAGYTKQDLGTQVITTTSNKRLVVKETKHMWYVGLVTEDWRSVGRICNIEVADALALTNNQAPSSFLNVLHLMLRMKARMRKPGRKVFYVNETIHTLMMRLALEKSSSGFTVQTAASQFGDSSGEMQDLRYMGTPVRLVDRILNTEAVVTA